jgi:cation diffusion facilitator CzcD-associated flavoprotein CzcO
MAITIPDYDAIVIGGGFSGIRMLWKFQRLGLTARCFDAGSEIGGTWWCNRYPGCRTDREAWVYALRFLPELLEEWDFTERYPSQEEIQWYLRLVVDRYDLRRNIKFRAIVVSAHYGDCDNLWSIRTKDGSMATSRYFLPATGITSTPKEPSFPGLRRSKGRCTQRRPGQSMRSTLKTNESAWSAQVRQESMSSRSLAPMLGS